MVVWEYPPHVVGGLGTYSGALAPALRAAGHDVQVFAALRDGDAPDPQPDTHWARQLDLSPTYLGVYNQEASELGGVFRGVVLDEHPLGRCGAGGAWAASVRRDRGA